MNTVRIPTSSISRVCSDIEKRGRQHTDPLLRIGFNEPNALAIIGKPCEERVERLNTKTYTVAANDGSGDNHIFHLYVREKDPKAELWDGARSGTRAAIDVFNADEVRSSCLPLQKRL